jgi:hypothetical protein
MEELVTLIGRVVDDKFTLVVGAEGLDTQGAT